MTLADLSADPSVPAHSATAPAQLCVTEARWEADGVLSFELRDPAGDALPEWAPGAHLEIALPSGLVRHYSLCGDPADRSAYRVAVLREPHSRGGSRELHEQPLLGRILTVSGPRNHFRLEPAGRYLFVAGGIGITPILPMVAAVERLGRPWRLVYGGRTLGSMAFRTALARHPAGRVQLVPQDTHGLPDLDRALNDAAPDMLVYCCGPEGLLAAVQQRCAPAALRLERFAADPARPLPAPGGSFQLELHRSGITCEVPEDRTVLDVARNALPDLPYSCQEGICGTCETTVLEGEIDHRDEILTDTERAAGTTMLICVSRCRSSRLVLDL